MTSRRRTSRKVRPNSRRRSSRRLRANMIAAAARATVAAAPAAIRMARAAAPAVMRAGRSAASMARRAYVATKPLHGKIADLTVAAADLAVARSEDTKPAAPVAANGRRYASRRLRRNAKRPTFAQAAQAIMADLSQRGWTVATRDARTFKPLKFPHATDPNRNWRVWFKTQAVYLGGGGVGASINDARSLHVDIRDLTPEQFFAYLQRFAR